MIYVLIVGIAPALIGLIILGQLNLYSCGLFVSMCFLQGYGKPHELPGKEMEYDTKIVDEPSRSVEAAGSEMVDNFPKLIAICKYSHSLLEACPVRQEATD